MVKKYVVMTLQQTVVAKKETKEKNKRGYGWFSSFSAKNSAMVKKNQALKLNLLLRFFLFCN